MQNLADTLEKLYETRSAEHLANDPLSFCHRYKDVDDQEVAALVAAAFAYGNVKVIKGSLEKVFNIMGDSPATFVERFNPAKQLDQFSGFKHRFNNHHDLAALLWGIGEIRRRHGTLERFFCCSHHHDDLTVENGLNHFCSGLLSLDYKTAGIVPGAYYSFLFPSPAGKSACKRLCMFLRWVVRKADRIDLGLWKGVRADQLVIPVDKHIERIGRLLGLTGRKTADWKMACEITNRLRQLDPEDPVKYDFSICHLGISEGCNGKRGAICQNCPVSELCTAV